MISRIEVSCALQLPHGWVGKLPSQVASTSYEGSADTQGRWSGRGRVVFKSGAIYDGCWSAGQMHGLGKITFPDGICYEGEFKNNKLTGKGVRYSPFVRPSEPAAHLVSVPRLHRLLSGGHCSTAFRSPFMLCPLASATSTQHSPPPHPTTLH